jgi:hypothetical protein
MAQLESETFMNEDVLIQHKLCAEPFNLETIKSDIEKMSKNHHIEILKILKRNSNVKLNENKSGVYINLSFLSEQTLVELYNYINYIHDQETSLNQLESQKNDFKNTFFLEKGVKDELTLSYSSSSK